MTEVASAGVAHKVESYLLHYIGHSAAALYIVSGVNVL